MVPLSDVAVDHLFQLPHLRALRIEGPPPTYSTSSLPFVLPPLAKIILGGLCPTRRWISLFQHLEGGASTTQGMTPLFEMKKSLKTLSVEDASGLVIDASFTSPIQIFRNLVHLSVWGHGEGGKGQCTFKLDNDNVTKLAAALPRLETLFLGGPCIENICTTTVVCLLQISVHCSRLKNLEIHFNTTSIIDDFKNISNDPQLQHLRSSPRCTLSHLFVDQMPLILDEPGFKTMVNGMIDIFPSLERCVGVEDVWNGINERISELREMRMLPAHRQ